MAADVPGTAFNPVEMMSIRGEEPLGLASLEQIAKPLGDLALAVVPALERLKESGIGGLEIIIEGQDDLAGTIKLRLSEGEATVRLLGRLGSELPVFRGVPFFAAFDGIFFRQPAEGMPVIIEDGSEAKKGEMIGWCFKTKGLQWPEIAPASGTVHFAIEDETPVKKGETVMYYIEEKK